MECHKTVALHWTTCLHCHSSQVGGIIYRKNLPLGVWKLAIDPSLLVGTMKVYIAAGVEPCTAKPVILQATQTARRFVL